MKKIKILILGSSGSLGSQLVTDLKNNYQLIKISRKNHFFDENFNQLKKLIIKIKPCFIINCIAILGLKFCENNLKETLKFNYKLPKKVSDFCSKNNIKFIHFSSEAVFIGNKKGKIYGEDDKGNPSTLYGISKFKADRYLIKRRNTLVVRLPLLYGPTNKNQIVSKLVSSIKNNKKIYVSTDVYSTPVYTPFVSSFIKNFVLVNSSFFFKKKIIHISTNNLISMYCFIKKIVKIIKKETYVFPVKDSFFNKEDKNVIKPKYLGLKTKFAECIDKTVINKKLISGLIK
jgi:nucleoside-diphosphate-sugar epimerase